MTNYNDGDWHGWNGGECPVHPESVVEVVFERQHDFYSVVCEAKDVDWDIREDEKVIVFRVVKAYREPREIWVNEGQNGLSGWAHSSEENAVTSRCYGHIATRRFREVLE